MIRRDATLVAPEHLDTAPGHATAVGFACQADIESSWHRAACQRNTESAPGLRLPLHQLDEVLCDLSAERIEIWKDAELRWTRTHVRWNHELGHPSPALEGVAPELVAQRGNHLVTEILFFA
jgi:hypothetical protein